MTVSGVRSSWLALAMNCRWLVNARSSRSSIVSKVSASSRSSSRGPLQAMRWDRFCSLAARAAAVSRCTGRRMRPATIQPATAASSVTPAKLSSE
jgi:hypothetical protein